VLIVVLSGILFAAAGAYGADVAGQLSSGGFDNKNFESSQARDQLSENFPAGVPNLVLIVSVPDGDVDDTDVATVGRELSDELRDNDGISSTLSYWDFGAAPLRGPDGDSALILATIDGNDDTVDNWVSDFGDDFIGEHETADGRTVVVGGSGFGPIFHEIGKTIEEDLIRAELIALPLTLILLLFVFRSLVAALLPLLVGGLAIVGAFVVLKVVSSVTEVSIFSLNMTTAMSLGLAIDYSLFIVSRFREELDHGKTTEEAVVRTVETAGRTIFFSAVTVGIALSALLVFPLPFLRSFGWAGLAVSFVAAVGAIVFLPAVLAILGPRVNRLAIWRRQPKPVDEGFWHRIAQFVMRRPATVAITVTAFLLLLGTPFLRIELGLPDDRVLPEGAESREATDRIRDAFDSSESTTVQIVAVDAGDPATVAGNIEEYALGLSSVPGVARVDAVTGVYSNGTAELSFIDDGGMLTDGGDITARFAGSTGTWFSVVPDIEPISGEGERLIHDIRSLEAPFDVAVGGQSAELVDSKEGIFGRLPLALALIAVAMFVLLFLAFGSIVVPLKALALNILSLTATFGAMVWIFQDGNLSDLLNVTATGTLTATVPILMFCVAFGLSMDYEVFLLSRIKEEYDRSGDNASSVALGLEKSGRIVSAAAILISIVFLAFVTNRVSFMVLFGLGLALAVLMDAFVVRGTLVPAFMRLAGDWNWWAPRWMKRIHARIGISEADPDDRFDASVRSA